jgi:hypothetical protein
MKSLCPVNINTAIVKPENRVLTSILKTVEVRGKIHVSIDFIPISLEYSCGQSPSSFIFSCPSTDIYM